MGVRLAANASEEINRNSLSAIDRRHDVTAEALPKIPIDIYECSHKGQLVHQSSRLDDSHGRHVLCVRLLVFPSLAEPHNLQPLRLNYRFMRPFFKHHTAGACSGADLFSA